MGCVSSDRQGAPGRYDYTDTGPLIHSTDIYFLSIYYMAGTGPGTERMGTNKTGQNPCPPGAFILARETDD